MNFDIDKLREAVSEANRKIAAAEGEYDQAASNYSESFRKEMDQTRESVKQINEGLSACGTAKGLLCSKLEKILIDGNTSEADKTEKQIDDTNKKISALKARKQIVLNHRVRGEAELFQAVKKANEELSASRESGQAAEDQITGQVNEMIKKLEAFRDSVHTDIFTGNQQIGSDYSTLQNRAVHGVLARDQLKADEKKAAEDRLIEKALNESEEITAAIEKKEAEKAAAEAGEKWTALFRMPLKQLVTDMDDISKPHEEYLQKDGTYSRKYDTSVLKDPEFMEARKQWLHEAESTKRDKAAFVAG